MNGAWVVTDLEDKRLLQELRVTMARLESEVAPAADPLDELRARRSRKLHGGGS